MALHFLAFDRAFPVMDEKRILFDTYLSENKYRQKLDL